MFWTVVAVLVVSYIVLDRVIRLLKVPDYSSKYVFVTGCDSGFGRDLVIRLDRLGFHVFAACLTVDGREYITENCSTRVETVHLNVTDNDSILQAFKFVKEKLPNEKSLWAVVNNAGVSGRCAATEMCSHDDYVFACKVNLFGPIEVSRVFMPLLRRSKGRLVIITSVVGRIAFSSGPYAVSKFALEAFGDVIRQEVRKFGVKVSLIEPGFFRTDFMTTQKINSSIAEGYKMADPEVQAAYGRNYIDWSFEITGRALEHSSPATYKVVDAYVEAITSTFPRPRYVVGNDATFFLVPLSFLPEFISDWVFGCIVGRPKN